MRCGSGRKIHYTQALAYKHCKLLCWMSQLLHSLKQSRKWSRAWFLWYTDKWHIVLPPSIEGLDRWQHEDA